MKINSFIRSSAFLPAAVLLSGCGGLDIDPTSTYEQVTIHSTPAYCVSDTAGLPGRFCGNTSSSHDYSIRAVGPCGDVGFAPEWGVNYVATIKKTATPGAPGYCGISVSLISIDGQSSDSVGTRYTNRVGSAGGGLEISRMPDSEKWFILSGYPKPIFCDVSICQGIKAGTVQDLPSDAEFELFELDGQRQIKLVSKQ